MSRTARWLLIGASVAGILWLWSRTQAGQSVIAASIAKGGSIMQQLTDAGRNMIARFEGFSAHPYNDPPGSSKWSIGYGHQIQPGETFNEPITQAEAQTLLAIDTAHAQNIVRSTISRSLTPAQFDALTSFVYNVGEKTFTSGTVPAKINNGDYAGAAEIMRQYIHSAGRINNALIARRAEEASAFA